MKVKRNIFKQYVVPIVVIAAFAVGLFLWIEDYLSTNSDYQIADWETVNGRSALPQGRAEVSQQLAVQICRQRASAQLGSNLLQSTFDKYSSRYNEELKVHTIFSNLIVKDREREPIYIRCDISAVDRTILESRIKGMVGYSLF